MSESARVSMIMMLGAGGLVTGGMVRYAWERIWTCRRLNLHEYAVDFRRSVRKADPAMPILLVICGAAADGFAAATEGAAPTLAFAGKAHVRAAKAGVDMLTRVLAIGWGGDGIRVNSVVPGPIEGTEGMARLAPTPQAREIVRATVPAARWGTPRDVTDVCLFLASPLAAYVTGVVLPADGGSSLGGASTAMAAIAAQLPTRSGDDSG
jgi:NAD(P)-dependent dehydrogenase (short-subunit alcohol dehydrogenase family)